MRFPAPGALEVGPLMATKRWCGSPASDVERDFLAALEQAGRFERDGDHLRLVTGTQESPVELIFEARPLPAQD